MKNNLLRTIETLLVVAVMVSAWASAQSSASSAASGVIRSFWEKVTGTPDIQNTNTGNVLIPSGNLGIGVSTPTQKLQIDGALRLKPSGSTQQPTCSASTAGSVWYKNTPTNQKDQFEVCVKDQNNVYSWVTMGCSV